MQPGSPILSEVDLSFVHFTLKAWITGTRLVDKFDIFHFQTEVKLCF